MSKARPRTAPRRQPGRATPAYHHGDLRRALLDATEALLDEDGIEAFTLREVARRAGVSHGAPAHHFGDVRGLLSAFSAESFGQLAAAMQRRRDAATGEFERLVAIGVGYVEYALGHRARFQLMFRTGRLDLRCEPLHQEGGRAYRLLVECVAAVAPTGDESVLAERTALAWSIVHGFATLMLENGEFGTRHGPEPKQALAVVERLLLMSRPSFEGTRMGRPPRDVRRRTTRA